MTDPTRDRAIRSTLGESLPRGSRAVGGRIPRRAFVIEPRGAHLRAVSSRRVGARDHVPPLPIRGVLAERRADEGLTPEELEAVTRWRRTIAHVATE
jgi:hypothetical protein